MGLILARLGLSLHPDKTRVVDVGVGGAGFDFLGFHCRKVESWKWRGKRYLHYWPSRRALQRIRGRIKALTVSRHRLVEAIGRIVEDVNLTVRGWGAYFRVGTPSRQFEQVDSYVRERLGLFLRKKTGRAGRGWRAHNLAFFERLGVYHLSGTVGRHRATPTAVR